MPHFLLLETSTDICAVAWSDGHSILAERETRVFKDHGRLLTTFIEEIREEVGLPLTALAAIGVSQGPGSFTSLRIGIATAKGLAYALNKPLLALDAFAGMAELARQEQADAYYLPLIDARSMGVVVAVYDQFGNLQLPVERRKLDANFVQNWLAQAKSLVFCGNAAEKYRESLGEEALSYRPDILPGAAALQSQAKAAWEAASFVDLAYFEPRYIAPPNITSPKKRQRPGRI